MRNLIGIFLLIVVGLLGGRLIYYGFNAYSPPVRPLHEVSLEESAISPRLETVDNPTTHQGIVVVDYTHDNTFFVEELNTLLSKVVARGFSYEVVESPVLAEDDAPEEGDQRLIEALDDADALIVSVPTREYSDEEIIALNRFIETGGRILIIGDPTRTIGVEALNSVASSFGIIYANDYLYSLKQNDNNYRNVIYTRFNENPLTAGLDKNSKIILYASGSVKAPGYEVILGDETTFSSTSEDTRTSSPAVLTTQNQVLALGDLTFFNEPYSAIESNGIFINNIADFIVGGERQFDLQDFPYFLSQEVDIVFDNSKVFNSQFEKAVILKEFLEEHDHTVTFINEIPDNDHDLIFIGRYEERETVQEFLDKAQITILDKPDEPEKTPEAESVTLIDETTASSEETESILEDKLTRISDSSNDEEAEEDQERFIKGRIQIEGVGELERGGSSLFYLDRSEGRNIIILLTDNPDTNEAAFDLLLDNNLEDCLVNPSLAVCQTEEPDEEKLPPTIRSLRIDKILVVSDDDALAREDEQTSALIYNNVLSDSYKIDIWETSDDGSPDLKELLEYDAVIWTTGDYWDDSIGESDAQTLTEYIEMGGNLLISGASIAFDWDHSDFLTEIVHADYLAFSEQTDLQVALTDHPIAKDFEDEDEAIEFVETPSEEDLNSDVVAHTAEARVIFERGSNSDHSGAAAVIAYEDDRSKIAYYAFPAYLLPAEAQTLLIRNTVDWFSRSILDLPDEDDYEPYEIDGQPQRDDNQEGEEEEPSEEGNGEEEGTEGDGGDEQEESTEEEENNNGDENNEEENSEGNG